jgi:flagellar biosynthetic protein FliR
VELSAGAFSTALGIAAPAVGILLLTSMSLGILTRTVPQMNVFIVGFPLKITAGIVGVALTLPFLVDLARREIGELAQRLAAVAAGA